MKHILFMVLAVAVVACGGDDVEWWPDAGPDDTDEDAGDADTDTVPDACYDAADTWQQKDACPDGCDVDGCCPMWFIVAAPLQNACVYAIDETPGCEGEGTCGDTLASYCLCGDDDPCGYLTDGECWWHYSSTTDEYTFPCDAFADFDGEHWDPDCEGWTPDGGV